MKVPRCYSLMAHTIKVKLVAPDKWKHADCVAFYEAEKHQVVIRDAGDSGTGHALMHEITHSILSAMGHPLNNDEAFVDAFSGLLHQVLETFRYPRQPRRTCKKNK